MTWTSNGMPAWTLKAAQGRLRTIDGRRAKVLVQRSRLPSFRCGRALVNETISVAIRDQGLHDNWLGMVACLNGPDTASSEKQVRSMLASVRFDYPPCHPES